MFRLVPLLLACSGRLRLHRADPAGLDLLCDAAPPHAEGATDPDLTTEGQRSAQLLADWFGSDPPGAIFVSNTKRAQQTAAPLAARLGITPIIYDPRDTPGLIGEIMKEPPPVLIVGHSNTVPDIVEALGGTRPEPLTHEDFGDIWEIGGERRGGHHAAAGGAEPASTKRRWSQIDAGGDRFQLADPLLEVGELDPVAAPATARRPGGGRRARAASARASPASPSARRATAMASADQRRSPPTARMVIAFGHLLPPSRLSLSAALRSRGRAAVRAGHVGFDLGHAAVDVAHAGADVVGRAAQRAAGLGLVAAARLAAWRARRSGRRG